MSYTQGQGGPDPTLDVADEIEAPAKQEQEKTQKSKQAGKGANEKDLATVLRDRARDLGKLVGQMLEELIQNKVLAS
jgi:hypothetical protein